MSTSGTRAVPDLVDRLFREEFGRMVAGLARVFGAAHLELVEDVVQEALVRALRTWPFEGVPENPRAWLVRVARNGAIDALRRNRIETSVHEDVARWADAVLANQESDSEAELDDTLRLMALCCHPLLAFDSRVALTLKTVCGFGVGEIARAFLADETAVAQRLVRAKRKIQEAGIALEMPAERDLDTRLDALLEVVYLLFNEGYAACAGSNLIRADLVDEALRLVEILTRSSLLSEPRVHALAALCLFQSARLPARIDAAGEVLTLARQDRSLWDRGRLDRGWAHFEKSLSGEALTAYHVESAIAACHAAAPTYAQTDWKTILGRYDQLRVLAPSPVVDLNRAVALAKVAGVDAGLRALDEMEHASALGAYHLLPATRGLFLWTNGDTSGAAREFERARALAQTEPERELLARRIRAALAWEPAELF